ncbi:hypothetical protein, partial [Saliphagus infecundisoli]
SLGSGSICSHQVELAQSTHPFPVPLAVVSLSPALSTQNATAYPYFSSLLDTIKVLAAFTGYYMRDIFFIETAPHISFDAKQVVQQARSYSVLTGY